MLNNSSFSKLIFTLVLAAFAGVGFAQNPQPSANDQVTTPVTIEDMIVFNLRDADINSVVSFITKYTGKPVVKDNSVGAKLTVSSPTKIPAYEALDLIYDSLRMQNFVVIETEDLIQIVPAADTAKYDIMTFSGELPPNVKRQKGRLIRKIVPLNNVRATPMKANLDPLLGKHASIVADERTNKLLITDTVRNIERYESILAELDAIGFDNMEVRIVPLKHADATKLAGVLDQTVVKAAGTSGPAPGQEGRGQIVIMPDTRTNSLVITSPLEKMNSIVAFIERLDVPKPTELSVHVVPVRFAEANAIASAVTDVLRHKTGKSDQDQIEVRAMGRDNTLLVLASDENMKLIREIVDSLDTEESQKRETRRYELKYLDAEDTATELSKLYGDMQDSSRNNPYYFFYSYGSNRRNTEEVKFVPITRSNSIMVLAPPTEFNLIESLIEEIDQPIDADEILPKIYRIRYAKASDIEEILNAVFGKKTETSGFWDYWRTEEDKSADVGRLTGKIKFSSDDNTNSIIAITNNRMNYEVVDRMIAELDTTMPELANTMVVNLQHANAAILAMELNSLFGKPVRPQGQPAEGEGSNANDEYFSFWWGADSGRSDSERPISNLIEQVRFVPDLRTNSILVTTAAQNFEIIRGLIEGLDKEEPQVLIKVRIVEVQRDKDKRIGLRWTPTPGTYSPEDLENSISALGSLDIMDSIGSGNGPISTGSNTVVGRDLSQTLDAGNGIISSTVNLNLLLQLLVKNLDASIVISPTLYVSNNEKGHLFVGENIPRLKGTQITPEGTRNDTFENEDIGITMEIVPNISRNGQVVLNVNLTTAQRTGVTRFGSDVLQKRDYNTKVAVNNGDTMVLGGIRMSTDQKTVRKFPVLGDIPLLGYLFRNTVNVNQVTDLYAFITPVIISNRDEALEAAEEIQLTIGDPTKPHEEAP